MSAYDSIEAGRMPVLVDGLRTPFLDSGGAYTEFMNHELAAIPLRAVLEKTGVEPASVEMVAMGNVAQDIQTSNFAREAMLGAGLPSTIPAYTVVMAGVSPLACVTNVCDMIALGQLDTAVAGGSENFSDLPIRLARNVRQRAVKLARAKTAAQRLRILAGLRPKDLLPEMPRAEDYTTGLSMGASTEAMVKRFGVERRDADAFAARSHHQSAAAWEQGLFDGAITPVTTSAGDTVTRDNTVRADTSEAKLARLKPAFDKADGIVTAGNASGLTDGATANLLMSAAAADQRGLSPLATIRDYKLTGVTDMDTEMLLGPAMSIPRLLANNGLTIDDIEVFELHEAFAAQILANQQALASDEFARSELGLDKAPGAIPLDKLNAWGGSLALGNPFAATGGRLLVTAAQRLHASGGRYAVVATCAGGGLGAALLLENPTVQ